MTQIDRSYFTNKKTTVQFVLSLFVFFIHFRRFSPFQNAGDFLADAMHALYALTHVAVPLFFVISGVLFYRNYSLASTFQKWKSRFFSLVIPYLVWNTLWLGLALLGHYTPLGAYLGGVDAVLSWESVINGIFFHGNFEPFWFILQLIALIALCPVIYLFLKNKWIGLLTIATYFVLYCRGFRWDRVLFSDSGMVLFYLVGAWIGIHDCERFMTRRSRGQAWTALCVYAGCCVVTGVVGYLPKWYTVWQLPLLVKLISCGAFWIAFDLLDMKKIPDYMSHTFLIYAMHSLVGATLAKLLRMALPAGELFTALTALITFPMTVILICVFGHLITRYLPSVKRILCGR